MELKLVREPSANNCTLGRLFIDGRFECDTLEDVERPVKIPKRTAIPRGRYEVIINWSARFRRLLPLLLRVPNFDGIRIHPGNDDQDTEGCILVGQRTSRPDWVANSRLTFASLFVQMEGAARREKIYIEIEGKYA